MQLIPQKFTSFLKSALLLLNSDFEVMYEPFLFQQTHDFQDLGRFMCLKKAAQTFKNPLRHFSQNKTKSIYIQIIKINRSSHWVTVSKLRPFCSATIILPYIYKYDEKSLANQGYIHVSRNYYEKQGSFSGKNQFLKKTSQEDMSSYKCRYLVHFVGRERKIILAICLFQTIS